MRIPALNSSPRSGGQSKTELMLNHLVDGNSEAVGERKTILQFNFTGEVTDSCYFEIEQGNVDAEKGNKENPDITIETPFELWMDIVTRKADGQQMFMEQKYTVNGDISLMIQLFQRENAQ